MHPCFRLELARSCQLAFSAYLSHCTRLDVLKLAVGEMGEDAAELLAFHLWWVLHPAGPAARQV